MDKRVILAVAGSGKTTHIVNSLDLSNRSLIITYTNNNIKNLKNGIISKFGYFPENITLTPFFTFLYSFCYRPFLSYKIKAKGINYERNPNRGARLNNLNYFIDSHNRLYSNRIAKLLQIKNILNDINFRLSKYYDFLFIDEIQDFAGHDFNLLRSISSADLNIIFVGDFFQHTFDTSRDGNVNQNLHDNYEKFNDTFDNMGMMVDTESLSNSYRCSPSICDFITKKIGIKIYSHRTDKTKIHFIDTSQKASEIFFDQEIVKLYYREHYKYNCYSRNWGDCKGENNYEDVVLF